MVPKDGRKAIGAAVVAAGAGAAIAARRLVQRDGRGAARRAVTVNRPRAEVEEAWRGWGERPAGSVRLADAPGERGTEVLVEAASDPEELAAALRRFKQVVETGEVVRAR